MACGCSICDIHRPCHLQFTHLRVYLLQLRLVHKQDLILLLMLRSGLLPVRVRVLALVPVLVLVKPHTKTTPPHPAQVGQVNM